MDSAIAVKEIEVRILGPLVVIVDGKEVNLGGQRQRIVLSMLALNARRVTSVERLIDAVWATSPPSTARSQIQICISKLRKLITPAQEPEIITTREPGYLLEIPDWALDSSRFAALLASAREGADAGRLPQAVEDLEAALSLWRGPVLADVDSALVRGSAAQLEDRRRVAIEERLRTQLSLGRHEEITGELRVLLEEEPLWERLYGLLMLALQRSGRQGEALEVGRRAREVIVAELGIEPGPELRDTEQAILVGQPAAKEPIEPKEPIEQSREPASFSWSSPPWQLPPSIADFTGREQQLARLKRILHRQEGPPGAPYAMPIVTISGRGGVGKSSLAIRAAHELRESYPDGHLYVNLAATSRAGNTARTLGRFLRALGVSGSAVPEDPREESELYRSQLAQKRVLVVLDNVLSAEQVHPLLPGSPTCAVLVTSTLRLPGLPGAHAVDLDAFEAEESLEMLARIVGWKRLAAEHETAMELVGLCNDLPLALRIAGARLASRPHWQVAELTRRLVDETVRLDELCHGELELRPHLDLTLQSLSEPAQQLLGFLTLVQTCQIPSWAASALLGMAPHRSEELMGELLEARVLDVAPRPTEHTGHSDHRRRHYHLHDLLRVRAQECLRDRESEATVRAALTRFFGGWLALAEDAHRREHGCDYPILSGGAARWRSTDGDLIGDPRTWWESERTAIVAAIRSAAASGFDEVCWALALLAMTFFETNGYVEDWLETSQLAYHAAEQAGNRRGRAAMHYSIGSLRILQERLDEAEQFFAQALNGFEAEGDAPGSALVLRNSALVDRLRGNTSQMLVKYTEALGRLRSVGDRVTEAWVLSGIVKAHIDAGDYEIVRETLDESL